MPLGQLRRVLLALLVAHANRPIPVDRLLDALWGGAADERALHKLHTHVHRLRKALGDADRVGFDPGGYRLTVRPGELDAERFVTLLDEAGDLTDAEPQRAVSVLRKALEMWRGPVAYQDLDVPELTAEAQRLADRRLLAVETLYATELSCGRHGVVVAELTDIVRRHPLRERLHELLMTAYAIGGQQAEALRVYQDARQVVVDELGVEPGPRLRELERRVLVGEAVAPGLPEHGETSSSDAVVRGAPTVPAQLPGPGAGFVGRTDELDALEALLGPQEWSVAVVTGSAGVGKTTLALQWAHRVRDAFPDGQLYVDLRGYGPDEPRPPSHVLGAFLRALGVDGQAIPEDTEERAARLRSEVAGRRLLLVLDNARNAAQVRPLLPGTSTCRVVVTSRDALTGLSVHDGAGDVRLDRMRDDEARRLLAELLGDRHDAEAAGVLAAACAHLPLALRIAAERIRRHPTEHVSDLLFELADERARLDLLDAGDDPHTSVRAVLSWSYHHLPADAARLFRCFGLPATYDLDLYALAALADADVATTRGLVDALVHAHLVEATGPRRYRLHDLLRSYAVELTASLDTTDERDARFARLHDYYLRASARAAEIVTPEAISTHQRVVSEPMLPPLRAAAARRWLDSERDNLVAVAEQATAHGDHGFPMQLSTLLWPHLDVASHFDDALRLHTAALTAARAADDVGAEARALQLLGVIDFRRDHHEDAEQRLLEALALHERLDDRPARASAHNYLAGAVGSMGRADEAADHLRRAIGLYEDLDDPTRARALNNLGLLHQWLGQHDEARRRLEEGLRLAERTGNLTSQAFALTHLVVSCREAGEHDHALARGRRALELIEETGHGALESSAWVYLGTVHHRLGAHDQALSHYERGLIRALEAKADDIAAIAWTKFADLHADRGELAEAVRCYEAALACSPPGTWHEDAPALAGLGDAHAALDDRETAEACWRAAEEIYRDVGHPEADRLRELARS